MDQWLKQRGSDFGVAIALLILAVGVALKAYGLGLGAAQAPGPGFTIFWTAVLLGVLAARLLIRSLRRRSGQADGVWHGTYWGRALSTIAALLIYAFALETVGYVLITLVFTAFLFWLLAEDRKKWLKILSSAVLASGLSYVVFDRVFSVQLPKGWMAFFGS